MRCVADARTVHIDQLRPGDDLMFTDTSGQRRWMRKQHQGEMVDVTDQYAESVPASRTEGARD